MNRPLYAIKDTDTKDICFFSEFDLETQAWIKRHYIELDSGVVLYECDDFGNLINPDIDIKNDFDLYLEYLYKNYINFGG